MTYDVITTEQACFDMKTIYRYIADTLMKPLIAQKQYSRIEKAICSLEEMPARFRQYEKEPWRSRNLRIMPVDNYLVFYIVNNENRIVTAIRVMYGARNIEKELNDME
jgi:toxin ParE1/3/4